jgi:hypothetical protein
MSGENHSGIQCVEFETLLSEALDERLTGQQLEAFRAHARVCATCGPLFTEADAGRRWLKSLAEVEPPMQLVHNILVATVGQESARVRALSRPQVSWKDRLVGWVRPVFAVARQPRFAMSFGMAFFSLSISMSLAGVKLTDLQHADLRPSAIKRSYYETTGRMVKYYENIRFVYEIESRVRDFKRATTPAEPAPERNDNDKDNNKEHKNNNTSGQPEQKQERNYSQGENLPVLASLPQHPPVVTTTTDRRIS